MFFCLFCVFIGEGGEELPEGSEKIGGGGGGDDESGSMTPNSAASPTPGDDEGNSPPGDLPSPRSSVNEDVTSLQNHITEKYVSTQTYCSYLISIICRVLSFYLLLIASTL